MRRYIEAHPNLATWAILAVGMVIVLVWSARDVGLIGMQWFWLTVATVVVAGLCAWIISWEADDPDDELLDEALPEEESALPTVSNGETS